MTSLPSIFFTRGTEAGTFRYLRHQCRDTGIAEELFQDVWMNLIRARASYVPAAKFTTYLYRLARNQLIDHWRASRAQHVSLDDEESVVGIDGIADAVEREPESQFDAAQKRERLRDAIATLPSAQRDAFLLHYEGALSLSAIGELTDCGVETVKSRLRYANAKLRQALEDLL